MNKYAAGALIVILVLVIVVGKFHNRMFPRKAVTRFSEVTIHVPGNWIYSKGDKNFAFQLVVPSSRLAEPAGFVTAKNLRPQSWQQYIADNKKQKDKAGTGDLQKKIGYKEAESTAGQSRVYICTYTAKSKSKKADALECIVYSDKHQLWHIVGVFDHDWYNEHKAMAADFIKGFCAENLNTELKDLDKVAGIKNKQTPKPDVQKTEKK